ncbi:MAG: hypothetical protein A3I66_11480 [Burkholderiales bacterium RIFCSPLOWO2_02_FULL_57_36]|nr:MAG: hypothetical protein A3I66_11480 [Burkholderiales bacterium RIFCSPLOWO2_02_FULL_57_36]
MSAQTTHTNDARIDRLYQLLPAIYRMRDAEHQQALQALLRVIAEQVNLVEDDIARLYDNWFIETAEDWVVPYIADLIGYRPVLDAGRPGQGATEQARALNRVLIPRRKAANTIRYRRGKGRLGLLELLAHDVAGWPARAVEFFKLLGWHQNINHPHPARAQLADLRRMNPLDLLGGPFDTLAHTVDVRRVNSQRTIGRHNIPSIGVFVWRLKSYPVSYAPAYCVEDTGPNCYTFSVLGNDAPLFIKAQAQSAETCVTQEWQVPASLRRRAFESDMERFYGAGKSLVIWADGWGGSNPHDPLPASAVIAADLSHWQYVPPKNYIAVDPVLGRIAFPPGQLPRKGVRVSYRYGFSADMGGGEYARRLFNPSPRKADSGEEIVAPVFYRVGRNESFQRLWDALNQWKHDQPKDAVIELTDSSVHAEPFTVELAREQSLQLRAADRVRPVLRLLDWQTDLPDPFSVVMNPGSRFTLDGLMVTGRSVHFSGAQQQGSEDRERSGKKGERNDDETEKHDDICGAVVVIRHCTLVPGWGLGRHCEPARPAEPSLELYNLRASVRIEHSIVGSIQVNEDEVHADPIPLRIADSIVDAAAPDKEAIGAPGKAVAHVLLTILRSTVFGIVDVHAVELAENCIFNDCVNVARRQIGCMRFCYVAPVCRTPRRYRCQPDLAIQAVKQRIADPASQQPEINCEMLRVQPQFTSIWYGNPGYAQLALLCAQEIKRGADDESEMGAFHDLFQPQREANLRARLEEFTPAGMDVGIIHAT